MSASLRLPGLFSNHLVLQRDRRIPIWGWATPGVEVTAELSGLTARTTCGTSGRFRLELPALHAGGPHTLSIRTGDGESRLLTDILIGEVWLCSGQSNMEWPVNISGYSAADLAAGGPARLRLFRTPQRPSHVLCDDVDARWTAATAENLSPFSGVAYAFACDLMQRLDVPVGLIQSAWGGTAAEWWTPISALDAHPELRPIMDRVRAMPPLPVAGSPEYATAMKVWEESAFHQDPGNKGEGWGWAKTEVDAAGWAPMRLPQHWEATGLNIDGAVWFRKTIEIPAAWRGRDLVLSLGPVDDFDTTYVNGVRVGATGKETPNSYLVPRTYPVPGRLITSQMITVAVRVFDHMGNGGICGQASQMRLHPVGEDGNAVDLSGTWQFQVELALEPKQWMGPPPTADSPNLPERLWNGMLRPLAPYAIRGAIWYQGESNADRSEQYRILMRTMISCWRQAWGYDFPFYQVQLAPFMARLDKPAESGWAELREAQEEVAEDLPQVDCAVIIDSGDPTDIHPRNKALVGRRLARIALARTYAVAIEHSGPRFAGMVQTAAGLRVHFRHCQGGLVALGGPPVSGFALAGEDRVFHWAQAVIDADGVILSCPEVPKPVAVRYGWADNPMVTLINQDGLPTRPFRTDRWPGITTGKR